MKKIIVLSLLSLIAFCLAAQTPRDEAIQSLESAKKLLQQENYSKAQDEINYATGKINEILSEQLVLFVPDAPIGFTLEDKNAQGLGQMGSLFGSANAITATGNYSRENSDGSSSEMVLTISIGGLLGKAAGLAAMGQMFSGSGSGTSSKTIRVAGYNATQEFSAEENVAKLTVQVGEKVSVIVDGDNLDKPEIMKALVEKIDLAKLEKAF
ncbi:MAG: hypothetical protein PHO32_05680 [Candidatus Cloacimonetes bacterium]|nr:hypothetical protein [Candidatus Cloacimonadota bacterium]